MIPNRSKRGISNRFRPAAEALEDRSLMAIGQISLYIPSPAVGLGSPVRGSLPDGSINIEQFGIGSTNSTSIGSATGGAAVGKAQFSPLTVTLSAGPELAGLLQAETLGAHFNTATLTIRDTAARVIETLSFKLVIVASDSISASSGGDLTENVTFQYGSIQVTTMNPVTNTPSSTASFSQVLNQPTSDVPGITSLSLKASTANVSAQAAQTVSAKAVSSAVPTTINLAIAKPHLGTTLLTAKVTSTHGVPTGNVTFYAGQTELGQVAVGSNGKATLSVPTALLGKAKPFAIFSGGPDSTFQPSTTVSSKAAFVASFEKWLGRPMTQDEWVLTSIWSQQGLTLAKMTSIYKSLATKSS